jgi:hypothetical protein
MKKIETKRTLKLGRETVKALSTLSTGELKGVAGASYARGPCTECDNVCGSIPQLGQ